MLRFIIFYTVLFMLAGTVVSCITTAHPRLPTGVQRFDAKDGSIRVVATAMASENAIEKDSTAMMQTTSREAARLMLKAELEQPKYARIKEKFETPEAEFIDRGRYCRLTVIYSPPAPVPANR